MSDTVQLTEQSLASQIADLVNTDAVQLPPLPEVVVRARELLASDTSSMSDLAELLAQDAAVVAALLRLANSAAFGGLGRIENLNGAIQRIGLRQVGAIVTGLGLKGHFQHESAEKGRLLQILWDHSVTSAFATRAIARKVGLDPERAFLAGLLHDCGKVLVLAAIEKLEEAGAARGVTEEVVRELMAGLHAELGHRVLGSWRLPDDVAEVALRHHEAAQAGQDLILAVQAANLITKRLGFHLDPDPDLSVVEDPVIEDLGLDDMTVATLMIDMEDHLQEMKQLF